MLAAWHVVVTLHASQVQHVSNLQTTITRLQTEIAALGPQVDFLRQKLSGVHVQHLVHGPVAAEEPASVGGLCGHPGCSPGTPAGQHPYIRASCASMVSQPGSSQAPGRAQAWSRTTTTCRRSWAV